MISDEKISRSPTVGVWFFSLLQLHVTSSRFISALTLGWLGGWVGWLVGGRPPLLPLCPAQPSPLPSLPPPTLHLHAAQPNQSDPLLCIFDTHPRACPRSALPCGCLVCAQNNNDVQKKKSQSSLLNKHTREKRTPLIDWVVDGLVFRLRSVKMEQRKLNDQANSLVDLAKVRRTHSVLLHCT